MVAWNLTRKLVLAAISVATVLPLTGTAAMAKDSPSKPKVQATNSGSSSTKKLHHSKKTGTNLTKKHHHKAQ
jgi:hypothetical protein